MGHWRDLSKSLHSDAQELRSLIPEAYEGFNALHKGTMEDGALSGATKELLALAISVVSECDGCISAHARGAARKGVSEQEVAEAIGVTFLMAGGPATVWGPRALAAFREFAGS